MRGTGWSWTYLFSERFYLRISRITVVAVGVVSFLAALRSPELILNMVSYAVALVGVAFFFPMLYGLNSPYVSKRAATVSSVAGSSVGLFWTILHLGRVPWAMDIHPVVPGLAVALLPMLRPLGPDRHVTGRPEDLLSSRRGPNHRWLRSGATPCLGDQAPPGNEGSGVRMAAAAPLAHGGRTPGRAGTVRSSRPHRAVVAGHVSDGRRLLFHIG